LSRTRNVAMNTSPITLQEMSAYCDLFSVHDREAFVEIVSAMDIAFLDYRNKKRAVEDGA
jgi:hypothetical protein